MLNVLLLTFGLETFLMLNISTIIAKAAIGAVKTSKLDTGLRKLLSRITPITAHAVNDKVAPKSNKRPDLVNRCRYR